MPDSDQKGVAWAALEPDAFEALKAMAPLMFPTTFHPHITLRFNTTRSEFESMSGLSFGARYVIRVIGYAYNDMIQAAIVDLSGTPIVSDNEQPHITLSAQEGVKPVQSNEMLAGPHETVLFDEPLELGVVIEFFGFKIR